MPIHSKYARVAVVGAIVVLASLVSPGCNGDGDQCLAARIGTDARKGVPSVVKMSALTDFAWEKLFVFGPYTPA